MTLVVARIVKGRIAIASDTMLTEHDRRLPPQEGVIKSGLLPGDICVSFSNSPELAKRDFRQFSKDFPAGAGFADCIAYFEQSSANTGNEYIVAFSANPKLVKIVDGKRTKGLAGTQWIGDKEAYEAFRAYEGTWEKRVEKGRAINAVLFADELKDSPASDLYSTMRHVIADRQIGSAGGFAFIVSNRDNGFRQSAYSDMLFNWPEEETEDFILQLSDKIDLGASGENKNYAISQISPGFMGVNVVAFYILSGRKLFLYYGEDNGMADNCVVINNVEPSAVSPTLTAKIGDLKWLLMITAAAEQTTTTVRRAPGIDAEKDGVSLAFFTHANTFPPSRLT